MREHPHFHEYPAWRQAVVVLVEVIAVTALVLIVLHRPADLSDLGLPMGELLQVPVH
jgi:hypothetical protein